jgi:hypothetical protein
VEEDKEDGILTNARNQFTALEERRADSLQLFKNARVELQKAHDAVRAADAIYREAGEEMKKAREKLDDSEARSSLALKALMEVERR